MSYDGMTDEANGRIGPKVIDELKGLAKAIEALKKMGEAATDPLIRALESRKPNIRHFAAKALGEMGSSKATGHLVFSLNDEEWPVRMEAATALGKIGDRKAVLPLFGAIADRHYKVSKAARFSLLDPEDDRKLPNILQALTMENNAVRRDTRDLIIKMSVGGVPVILDHLHHPMDGIGDCAAWILGAAGDARAVNPLIDGIHECFIHTKKVFYEALSQISDPSAKDILTASLVDEDVMVRRGCANALARIERFNPGTVDLEEVKGKMLSLAKGNDPQRIAEAAMHYHVISSKVSSGKKTLKVARNVTKVKPPKVFRRCMHVC